MAKGKTSSTRRSKDQDSTITAVSVAGFKSISDEQRIEIRPLTILAGANSSGKSSMIQPLLLLKQTLESPFDPGPLRLEGPNVRMTSSEQWLSKVPGEEQQNRLTIGFEYGRKHKLVLRYSGKPGSGIDIESMSFFTGKSEERYYLGMPPEQIARYVPKDLLSAFGKGTKLAVVRVGCFLAVEHERPEGLPFRIGSYYPAAHLVSHLIHVPAVRGDPERTYRTTAVGRTFPGTFEGYVASIVSSWQANGDREKLRGLGQALEHLGLTWKAKALKIDDTRVELRVGRLPRARRGGAGDLVSIADVGFGVSQALPVVVALMVAEKNDTVYLEQPEIHLHPNAQARMAKILADAAKRGVRVIVETHSSLLLRGVQTLVAQGELSPALVKLHWFQRSEETGSTRVTAADLDNNGAFGDWPEDFDDVALASERHYLDAVAHRSAR